MHRTHATTVTKALSTSVLAALLALTSPSHIALADTLLEAAQASEDSGDYRAAVDSFSRWINSEAAAGADKRYVKIKLPVLQEAIEYGGGADLNLYLQALTARANKDIPAALSKLEQLLADFPTSRLRDDSHYLIGYIHMMDNFDFGAAATSMAELQLTYPDSRYFDTALYSQAIAEEQQGNIDSAATLFGRLRDRHTQLSIGMMDLVWPRDNLDSRYWFDRSSKRIEIIESAMLNAARIIHREKYRGDEYQWRVTVLVADRRHSLLLNPSPVFNNTRVSEQADGAVAASADQPPVETLAGIVEGESRSWVRVTIRDNQLNGLMSIHGHRQPLMGAATDGTLGAYNRLLSSDIDGNQGSLHDDAPTPPGQENAVDSYLRYLHSQKQSDDVTQLDGITHVARLGVVIDSQYNNYHGGRGLQEALSILNTTDGIFREEFGIALHVDTAVVITDSDNDPMNIGSTTMEAMMRNFRDYRRSSSALGSDIGLATLFSGNKNNDLPLGLAWIGTACRTDGYDVSVVTPFSEPGLLSTHEIAHTMGAPHDFDTECNESRYLMSRYISGDTLQTFSSCSRQAVANLLANTSCHSEAIDLAVDFGAISTEQVQVSLKNTDMVREIPAANLRIEMDNIASAAYPEMCDARADDVLLCQFGAIGSVDDAQVTIDLPDSVDTSSNITAFAEPIGFYDVESDNNAKVADLFGSVKAFTDGQQSSNVISAFNDTSSAGSTGTNGSVRVGGAGGGASFNPVSILLLGLLAITQLRVFQRD